MKPRLKEKHIKAVKNRVCICILVNMFEELMGYS